MYHLILNQVKTPKRNKLISVLHLGVGVIPKRPKSLENAGVLRYGIAP